MRPPQHQEIYRLIRPATVAERLAKNRMQTARQSKG
jgi:hypothetical protein